MPKPKNLELNQTTPQESRSSPEGWSPNDGWGWAFELETDATIIDFFAKSLKGQWIEKRPGGHQVNTSTRSVSGGINWVDPKSNTEYVSAFGYEFDSDFTLSHLSHLTHLYSTEKLISTEFSFVKTLAAKNLLHFKNDFINPRHDILSQDPNSKIINGVKAIYWKEGIQEIISTNNTNP